MSIWRYQLEKNNRPSKQCVLYFVHEAKSWFLTFPSGLAKKLSFLAMAHNVEMKALLDELLVDERPRGVSSMDEFTNHFHFNNRVIAAATTHGLLLDITKTGRPVVGHAVGRVVE